MTGLTATKGTTETIDIHLERDEINGLSSRIQVSKDYLKQKMVDGGWNNNYYTIKNKKRPEYDPCKYYYEDSGKTDKGIWRMPNQKELGLMSANNLLSGYVTCRTDYSGSKANGAYRSSYGFWFQGTNVTVHATDADLKVRCVKMLNSMNNLLEIMDKESCSKSEVYLYEEEGRWYAYHRSAKSLSKLSEAALKLKEACFFYGVMLDKVEVDLNKLLNGPWFVALCSDTEMILIKNDYRQLLCER